MNSTFIILSCSLVIFIIAIIWVVHVHKELLLKANSLNDVEKNITISAEIYKTTSQLVAGFAVMAGLILTVVQLIETKKQYEHTIRNQTEQMQQRNEAFSLKRFETAIINLESKNASRRTSGVLTINLIANEFPKNYKQIADDVLIAFVRDGFSENARKKVFDNGGVWPPQDKRLAIEILSTQLSSEIKSSSHFTKLDLSIAQIPNLKAEGIIFVDSNFSNAVLSRARLKRVGMNSSNLKNVNFYGADLSDAEIIKSDVRLANFTAATLSGASFEGSNLQGARFTVATMIKTSFKNANLSNASFTGVIMTGADLRGADLTNVELLSQGKLDQAIGDQFTKLPRTLTRPTHWH